MNWEANGVLSTSSSESHASRDHLFSFHFLEVSRLSRIVAHRDEYLSAH